MSATAQNFVYVYGKKREGAKENTLSKEVFMEMVKSAERFMPDLIVNDPEIRNIKQQ